MIRQQLQRRLEQLEDAVLPVLGEPSRIEVFYADPDGTKELGYVVEVGLHRGGVSRFGRKGRHQFASEPGR